MSGNTTGMERLRNLQKEFGDFEFWKWVGSTLGKVAWTADTPPHGLEAVMLSCVLLGEDTI